MMEIILAGVVSLVITLAAGKLLIPALIRLKAGQSIKEVGPTWHKGKQGTPTMGGLMFIIGIGIAILILGWRGMLERNFTHLYVYVFALVFGVIGYIDDYQKVKHHHNTGLTAPQKFLLQLAAAIAFLCLMRYEGMLSPNLYIPFFNTHLVLPWVVYMIFAAFVIIGTVNAVNITDGIDGLSSSVTVPVAVFFAVLGGMWQGFGQLGVFAGALVGGLLGFLCYNHYPAKVFMGDTGSLFLGGAVAALAFAYDMPLILLLVGFVYLCETLSDIIQVTYFKLTHGKRIFKMAPLHHHFEMCGWQIAQCLIAIGSGGLLGGDQNRGGICLRQRPVLRSGLSGRYGSLRRITKSISERRGAHGPAHNQTTSRGDLERPTAPGRHGAVPGSRPGSYGPAVSAADAAADGYGHGHGAVRQLPLRLL